MATYTKLEKELHRQFLGETPISDYLYQRLTNKSKIKKKNPKNSNIFVTGLARSGTTALLNNLYESRELGSFLYKYMPFILSPKTAKIYANLISDKKSPSLERYHKDGILINSSSPECLDEVFWIKSYPKIKTSDELRNISISFEILRSYEYLLDSYSAIQNKERMLIKNNNNHQRIISLAKYFDKSHFLLLFREPLSHANSLLSQHRNFLTIQKKDPFILEYMNLIGHREFGMGIKPFLYSSDNEKWSQGLSKESLKYWILQWIHSYEWILNSEVLLNKNIYLISYENICTNKSLYSKICHKIGLKNDNVSTPFKSANNYKLNSDEELDSSIIKRALKIYEELNQKSIK